MKVTIAAAQYPITEFGKLAQWEDHVEQWISDAVHRGAQLLLFPEYGSMELASLLTAEERSDLRKQVGGLDRLKDRFLEIFSNLASHYRVVIVAPSIPVLEGTRVLNRAYVFSSNGLAGFQDKWFMTRFEAEEWGIQAGAPELKLFEADWGAFGVQICYDVEFPVGAQVLCASGAELILAPSCTETIRGATRVHVGARARALENQCYVAVAQTIGEAPWSPAVDINYGFASVYSTPDAGLPEEGILSQMTPQEPGWLVQELDFEKIRAVRVSGQVFNFKDSQRLEYRFHGKVIEVVRVRV